MSNKDTVQELQAKLRKLEAKEEARRALAKVEGANADLLIPFVTERIKDGLDAEAAVEELQSNDEFARLFGRAAAEDVDLKSMSEQDKRRFVEEHGLDAYLKAVERTYAG